MALVSLKQEEDYGVGTMINPDFGYGTSICLNGEQTEAMGLSKMAAGQKVSIRAIGFITRSTEELEAGNDSGGRDLSISIQFTEMEIKKAGSSSARGAAAVLYGDED